MNGQIIDIIGKVVSAGLSYRTPSVEPRDTESLIREFMEESDRRFTELESRFLGNGQTPGQNPYPQIREDRSYPILQNPGMETQSVREPEIVEEGKAEAIATGCIPCAMGHFGTCAGLLDEAVRFAHGEDGTSSPEVVDRALMCLKELNSMERVDLRPEMITQLKGWEREAAQEVLAESRNLRHTIEGGIRSAKELEDIAGRVDGVSTKYGRMWMTNKIKEMPKDDQDEVIERFAAKFREALAGENE